MKRFLCLFLLTIFLFSCTNVFDTTAVVVEPPLTISAFIYNESLEDYTLTPLEAGIVYELAPIGWDGLENINLHFACEGGSVRVLSEDEEVQLSMGNGAGLYVSRENRNYGYEMEIVNAGYIAASPWGCGRGERMFTQEDIPKMDTGYFGKEYYLKVIGYELDRPVVTMELTLTQLESEDSYDGKSSAYFSLEITSVAYSDRYQMMLEG